jgi:hypothetical protein
VAIVLERNNLGVEICSHELDGREILAHILNEDNAGVAVDAGDGNDGTHKGVGKQKEIR